MKMPGGGTFGRSAAAETRNPILRLPAMQAMIDQLSPETRRLLGDLLRQLAEQSACEGERCWRRGKAVMGAYWRVVSVYAKHIAHAIDRRSDRPRPRQSS
ncbi:MAG: hypothetical protein KGH75_01655 [Rhodospirillales bacterium]|nr:hypothetical protein [Rhodospirillales bacterium]